MGHSGVSEWPDLTYFSPEAAVFGASLIYRSLFRPAAGICHPSHPSIAVPFFLRFFLIYGEY